MGLALVCAPSDGNELEVLISPTLISVLINVAAVRKCQQRIVGKSRWCPHVAQD
jgi:hypothetical protein